MAELWALLHFIMPTIFDSHEEFNEWFSKDIESHAEGQTGNLNDHQVNILLFRHSFPHSPSRMRIAELDQSATFGPFPFPFSWEISFHLIYLFCNHNVQLSRLHTILKPFMLRRVKKEVEHELAQKTEVRCNVTMNSFHSYVDISREHPSP